MSWNWGTRVSGKKKTAVFQMNGRRKNSQNGRNGSEMKKAEGEPHEEMH